MLGIRPWEARLFAASLGGLGLGLLASSFIRRRRPERVAGFENALQAWLERWGLGAMPGPDFTAPFAWRRALRSSLEPLLLWLVWNLGCWALLWHRDPFWLPDGVDWHDSFLCAHAFLRGDPVFYTTFRYPLFPALGAVLSGATGLPISLALQVVGRLSMTSLVVPLYLLGRHWYGRLPALLGSLLLLSLGTWHVNLDTMTPYTLFSLLSCAAAAGTVLALWGSWGGLVAASVATALLFPCDVKGLAPGLVLLALLIPLALLAPGRPGRRLLRVAIVLIPLVGSYLWAHALPVQLMTLEEHSSRVLEPNPQDAGHGWNRAYRGYQWGKFEDAWTVPRTLGTFLRARANPAFREDRTRRQQASLERMARDYPSISWVWLALCGLGLGLPLLRPGEGWRERGLRLLQVGAVLGVVGSAWSSAEVEYQERYVLYAMVFLPLLAVGGVWLSGRLLLSLPWLPQLRQRRWHRMPTGLEKLVLAAGLLMLVGGAMLWPGSRLAVAEVTSRLQLGLAGRQEYELQAWAQQTLKPGELVVDSSWMMSAVMLIEDHPVARLPSSYPAGGAPWPNDVMRVTRPWPKGPLSRLFLVVAVIPEGAPRGGMQAGLAYAPTAFRLDNPAIEPVLKAVSWEEVYRTQDGMVRVLQHPGGPLPEGWQLPPGVGEGMVPPKSAP